MALVFTCLTSAGSSSALLVSRFLSHLCDTTPSRSCNISQRNMKVPTEIVCDWLSFESHPGFHKNSWLWTFGIFSKNNNTNSFCSICEGKSPLRRCCESCRWWEAIVSVMSFPDWQSTLGMNHCVLQFQAYQLRMHPLLRFAWILGGRIEFWPHKASVNQTSQVNCCQQAFSVVLFHSKTPAFAWMSWKRITQRQLAKYFHLPLADAARELGICGTLLKRVCRRHRISRWPYRAVLFALQSMIACAWHFFQLRRLASQRDSAEGKNLLEVERAEEQEKEEEESGKQKHKSVKTKSRKIANNSPVSDPSNWLSCFPSQLMFCDVDLLN